MRYFISVLFSISLLFSFHSYANYKDGIDTNQCSQFFPNSEIISVTGRSYSTLCKIGYAVIYDNECKIPALTFERLDSTMLDQDIVERQNDFREDLNLPVEYRSFLRDYTRSGFDRGHMVPAADMEEDSVLMSQTFYLSNIVPQYPDMNRGIWKSLETKVRSVILKSKEPFYVITGVVLGDSKMKNRVCIPSKMFKVIVSSKERYFYLIENENKKFQKLNKYLTNLERIQIESGFEKIISIPGFTFN